MPAQHNEIVKIRETARMLINATKADVEPFNITNRGRTSVNKSVRRIVLSGMSAQGHRS